MLNLKERFNLNHTQINRYLKWIGIGLGILLLLCIILYGVILYGGGLIVKDEDFILNETSTIETADGKVIKSLYEENRNRIDTSTLPNYIKQAFVSIEDRRFYDHGGVDFRSIARAVVRDVAAGSKVEGASTITQQVSKNLFLSQDKTFMRKTKEAMASIYLERHYTKDEILDLYLNVVYFGEGAYGIESAAHAYFSKNAEDLTVSEAALLAGLVKGPNGYSPIDHADKAENRRNLVLKAMEKSGELTAKERVKASRKTLGINQPEQVDEPWFDSYIDYVMKEAAKDYELTIDELKRGGYRIVVNIDEAAQKIAYDEFQNDSYFPGNTAGTEGTFVLRKSGGEIVALLGGRHYQLGDLNRVTVKRQPGSTMKPIAVYGPALMKKTYEPYSLLIDELKSYNGYTAKNYDEKYDGTVSLYEAIVQSKNAPAVALLDEIGLPYSKKYLSKMQIDLKDEGLSLALGGLKEGLTPIQMTDAYDTFRNDGVYEASKTIAEIYDDEEQLLTGLKSKRTKVFNQQVAWNMTEMLKYTVKKGTARKGYYSKALAGKTGSTQHPFAKGKTKDAWFLGYTPTYSISVWMGYDNSDEDHYLNGGSEYPTELAKNILTEFDKEANLQETFKKPKDVKSLPEPIKLPSIESIKANYEFGGLRLINGKLSWTVDSSENRIEYNIYRVDSGDDERIGNVKGKTEFVIEDLNMFSSDFYYVVPYDPLTKIEGTPSELTELSF